MKTTIYSNYDLNEMYDEIRQFLIDEMSVDEDDEAEILPTDNEVWNEVYAQDEMEWEDTFDELKRFFNNKKVIFFGYIGLWSGACAGGKIGDFEDLFYQAIEDCGYWELEDEDGHLFLRCSHHDGTDHFEIRELTDKGYNYSENWSYSYSKEYDYSEQVMHTHIVKCNLLSRLPKFAKKVYGNY